MSLNDFEKFWTVFIMFCCFPFFLKISYLKTIFVLAMHTLSKFSFNYYRNINFNHSLNQFLRRCSIGYTGRGCQRCPYPTYGNDCKQRCLCKSHFCNHITGCRQLPGIHILNVIWRYFECSYNILELLLYVIWFYIEPD